MQKVNNLIKKYEEVILYLIVGGLTTLVSILVYALFTKIFNVNYMISNIISWMLSVSFAYVMNKKFVFKTKCLNYQKLLLEIYQFFKYRIFSFVIDTLLMYLFVEVVSIDDMIAKVIVQVIVVILNYVFSKLFIFKK